MLETKTQIIGSISFTITNVCTCTEVDEDGNEVLDGNGYGLPPLACYGCFDDDKMNLEYEIIKPYLSMNGIAEGTLLRIEGSNMDWTRRSGYAYAEATTEAILDKLNLNTEWIIEFTLDNGKLSAVRRSHDEMGARFEFRVATDEEVEDNRW